MALSVGEEARMKLKSCPQEASKTYIVRQFGWSSGLLSKRLITMAALQLVNNLEDWKYIYGYYRKNKSQAPSSAHA